MGAESLRAGEEVVRPRSRSAPGELPFYTMRNSHTLLLVAACLGGLVFTSAAQARDFGFDFGDRGNWSSHHHHHHSCYDEQVAWAQRLLNRLGYSAGCVDGVLGDQTRRALIRYQCEHGLSHTGWLDSRTVCMLRDE